MGFEVLKSGGFDVVNSDEPKDAAEEWPVAKQIHSFYFVKYRPYDDPEVKAKLDQAVKELQKLDKARGAVVDELRAKRADRSKFFDLLDPLSEKLKAPKDEIQVLENMLKNLTEKKDKAHSNIQELRKQRDETNSGFYQGRTVLNKATDLAAQKNISELKELSDAEVEKFITLWCSKKNFREDYEKRILASLDARQLSRDGRMRNPEEKPLIAPEVPPS